MKEYTSTATRDGRWWVVQCDQVPQALSQVARLDQVEAIHREAIAFVENIPEADVSVTVRAVISPDVQQRLDTGKELMRDASEMETQGRANVQAAAIQLRSEGMSVRDIGWVLGISYQRVQQITTASPVAANSPAADSTAGTEGLHDAVAQQRTVQAV